MGVAPISSLINLRILVNPLYRYMDEAHGFSIMMSSPVVPLYLRNFGSLRARVIGAATWSKLVSACPYSSLVEMGALVYLS
jgi:hypothetical protein